RNRHEFAADVTVCQHARGIGQNGRRPFSAGHARFDNLSHESTRLIGHQRASVATVRQIGYPLGKKEAETIEIERRPRRAELLSHAQELIPQRGRIVTLIFLGEQRTAVEKGQHLSKGAGLHLSYGIDGLGDLINTNVFDLLRDQSFIKDLKASTLPEHRLKQRTVHEFHVSIRRRTKDSQKAQRFLRHLNHLLFSGEKQRVAKSKLAIETFV